LIRARSASAAEDAGVELGKRCELLLLDELELSGTERRLGVSDAAEGSEGEGRERATYLVDKEEEVRERCVEVSCGVGVGSCQKHRWATGCNTRGAPAAPSLAVSRVRARARLTLDAECAQLRKVVVV